MRIFLVPVIALLLLGVSAPATAAKPSACMLAVYEALAESFDLKMKDLVSVSRSPRLRQTDISDGYRELMGANAHAYAHFVLHKAPQFLNEAQLKLFIDTLSYRGQGMTDSHPGNYSVGLFNGKIRVVPSDMDDVGEIFLFFEPLHYIASVKALIMDRDEKLIGTDEMMEAYQKGLRGKLIAAPKEWQKILNMSPAEYLRKQEEVIARRLKKDGKFKYKKNFIMKMEQDPKMLEELQSFFPEETIIELVTRGKTRGGSFGGKRYWFSVENKKGQRRIFELKENLESASEVIGPQVDHEERMANFMHARWGGVDANYRVVDFQGRSFQLRIKDAALFENPWDLGEKELRELALYQLNQMGVAHAQLSRVGPRWVGKVAKVSEKDPAAFNELIRTINNAFFDYMKEKWKP